MRFTIGAGDKQAIQPSMNNMIPITRRTVAIFFQELGECIVDQTFITCDVNLWLSMEVI